MPRREDTVYLIDGSAQLHRAYFAIRSLTTTHGLPTGATYGFTTMLRKLYQDEDPEWVGISFDLAAPTFRHAEYKEYKAHRRRMEDDLVVQLPYVRRVCDIFGLPVIDSAGFEADDVIATLSRQAVEGGHKVVVVTGDKDFLQMVTDDVLVLNPGREGAGAILYDPRTVEEKFGVRPERVVDVLALVGDAVDNVPGVPGIGDKGARDLIKEFGTLEAALDGAAGVKRAAYREGLTRHREEALLSKKLVTLRTDVPVTLELEKLKRRDPDRAAAFALFTEMEFAVLAKEFAPEPAPTRTTHRVVAREDEIRALVAEVRSAGRVAVSLIRDERVPMRSRIAGVALSHAAGESAYVPVLASPLELPGAVPRERVLALLAPLLEDPQVRKVTPRAKYDRMLLAREGLGYEGLEFDVLLASYMLNPGRRSPNLEDLTLEVLGERPAPTPGIAEGAVQTPSLDAVSRGAAQESDLTLRVADPLAVRLKEEGLDSAFLTLELPLTQVLSEMETAGVKVDVPLLQTMSRDMERQIDELTHHIHVLAGQEFNINSPIQLRDVLFEKLRLKTGKKTAKTRVSSTAEDVLEDLALEHELPRQILSYRAVQKLKSTYVDALPVLVNPETGRIHACFHQTVAATGRISVTDPNLQNIPIRTAEGRRIREAFVAEPGHLLLSADYSQIELRILAHLSKDATLVDTFRRGEDIHDRTSREIFGPFSVLSPDEQRRRSKMVNYALLYGKTAFTLAKDIGVSKKEAEEFIQAYFARYPSVRQFIDDTVSRARETGYVRTLLGRLRRLPDLRAKNFQVRMEAERQAMNTPVQGSAADLIKKAMIDLRRELRERKMASRLILQIHDELLLEVPEGEADLAKGLVRAIMEGALELEVPLVAEARLGKNWAEVH